MYTSPRYLYENKITSDSMITPSSQTSGVIGGTQKEGTGSAVMYTYGAYSGDTDIQVIVQIDDVSGGNEIGSATYRYRYSTTAVGTWEASGQTTASTYTTLSLGIQIKWTAGTGNDFEENDTWYFDCFAPFGKDNLIDLDRNSIWRSEAWATLITNGGFDSDASSWTPTDCTLASIAGGEDGQCLEITRTGGSLQKATKTLHVQPVMPII